MSQGRDEDASAANGARPRGRGVAEDRSADTTPTGEGTTEPLSATLALEHHAAPLPEDVREAPTSGGFGTLLEPMLHVACGGRISEVSWFRTDWQRGGALTGYARFHAEDGEEHPVVVKLPVPPCERYFLVQLQQDGDAHGVAPRVYAHGEMLGPYDLAWVVIERLHHGPLGPLWSGREFDLLVEAVGRFYAATEHIERCGEPLLEDWETLLARARKHAHDGALPQAQHWNKVLKAAGKKLPAWAELWRGRAITGYCHGDLHLGNAMTRGAPPDGPAVLIDYANTRVGHWVQDAIYFEHLFWARPHRLEGRKLAKSIARERKARGLPVDPDWARLAEAYRALLALSTPARLDHDGDPAHLQACLGVLERAVA